MVDGHGYYDRLKRSAVRLPRWARLVTGVLLILLGLLGFLPVLGFWMIPLGLVVLSVDLAPARRLRRRFEVWWERRRRRA
jgi:apolipoprotein N-acyltransferase